jgi:hypothetical protein
MGGADAFCACAFCAVTDSRGASIVAAAVIAAPLGCKSALLMPTATPKLCHRIHLHSVKATLPSKTRHRSALAVLRNALQRRLPAFASGQLRQERRRRV